MKYVDEFRSKKLVRGFADRIKALMPPEELNIMEVCGTHTQSFLRFGLDKLLPANLRLIAGPGCPVCVSAQDYIDDAIKLCRVKNTAILTFGDTLRIPGSRSNLEKERAQSGNVRVVYSPLDCLRFARLNPEKRVVFLAVGFETTAPTIALAILAAKKEGLKNLSFFCALKLIPAAMRLLVEDERLNLDGFLCPGHVSAIIGTRPYEFIPEKYGIGCCVSGFEPLDILEGLYLLLKQIASNKPQVANEYGRVVRRNGNVSAQKAMRKVFTASDSEWRGIGVIADSGLKIRSGFSQFDAERRFSIRRAARSAPRTTRCRCGDILKGLISPPQCPLFLKACSPDNPIGPCMVSSEGACNAYYKYRRKRET